MSQLPSTRRDFLRGAIGIAAGAGAVAVFPTVADAAPAVAAPTADPMLPFVSHHVPMSVPTGAEVLLETRLPYLTAEQRREVLRTTALESGHPLLDGPELWGRLELFTAADGYGAFDAEVAVVLDAARRGFHAADVWRNGIDGPGGLTKLGSGALTLAGRNRYRGGTRVREGVLVAAGPEALGRGDVELTGGTLRFTGEHAKVRGTLTQRGGELELGPGQELEVAESVQLGPAAVLTGRLDDLPEDEFPVRRARRLLGTFAAVTVYDRGGRAHRAEPCYRATSLSVRLSA